MTIRPARHLLILSVLLGACSHSCAGSAPAHQPGAPAGNPDLIEFSGMCDASAAIALSEHTFAVADDEDNLLRVYDARTGGAPLLEVDLSREILPATAKPKKKAGEADLEAAARIDELAFWMGSHGRNASGKHKPERLTFFATTLPHDGAPPSVVGAPYHGLVDELAQDPRYQPFQLDLAAQRAPKEPGALNIEGLARRLPEGAWIAFRNPTPGGKALLAALLNPAEVIHGLRARFDAPVTLALDGLGFRDLTPWRDGYLVLAGSHASEQSSRLFMWDGRGEPRALDHDLSELNPEAIFGPPGSQRVMLLSDDGTRTIGGRECKKLKDRAAKRFRGLWLALPAKP